MREIMLVLTQNCNLKCTYCYEEHQTSKIQWEDIKIILNSEYKNNEEDLKRKVYFFGGEPFLEFGLIVQTVNYIKSQFSEFLTYYSVTTNGTLIHDTIQNFLIQHRDTFEIVLSLDGTKEMHNENRKTINGEGSFDNIDIAFFQKYFPNCIAKMTISQFSFTYFSKGIIFIESLGFKCKANFASGIDLSLNKNNEILKHEFQRLIEHYSNNPNIPLCFMLDLKLSYILVPLNHQFRYCAAGVRRHCYCDNGSWYPCQGLMPMATGTNVFLESSFVAHSVMECSPCASCSFIRICRTCYAANYAETKNVYTPGGQTCILNKFCIITSARIQYNRLKNKSSEEYSKEERLSVMAILKIAKELDSFI